MARPQFFKGDYGGPLGSYDTAARLVAQAGQTQGAAMAGLGGNIAGAIEKYQLNKEKRAKEEDAAMASLSTMSPFDLQEMGQNNPKVMKAIKNALGSGDKGNKPRTASLDPICLSSRKKGVECPWVLNLAPKWSEQPVLFDSDQF